MHPISPVDLFIGLGLLSGFIGAIAYAIYELAVFLGLLGD